MGANCPSLDRSALEIGVAERVARELFGFNDDVDKLMKDRLRRFKTVVLDEAPGFVADGSIGLPVERANVVQLAALNIENGRVFFHGIQFVVDDSH